MTKLPKTAAEGTVLPLPEIIVQKSVILLCSHRMCMENAAFFYFGSGHWWPRCSAHAHEKVAVLPAIEGDS